MMGPLHRDFSKRTPQYRIVPAFPVCIYEPSVCTANDLSAISGHGFDFGDTVTLKAIGEYLERFTAFRSVASRVEGTVAEMDLSQSEQRSLVDALRQTCTPAVRESVETHPFRLIEVTRLAKKSRAHVPAIFLSLHNFDGHADADFAPVRDTSGSAIHPDKSAAFRGALLEFVERQCTTAMWVSRRCNRIFDPRDKLENVKARHTYDRMCLNGTMRAMDISFMKGASVVFCEFKSEKSGALVNFSCGCAASFDQEQALLKAFTEMWQTSLLLPQMEFFQNREYGSDTLKVNFQSANRPDFEVGTIVDPIEFGMMNGGYDLETLIQSLLSVSENIYVYFRTLNVGTARLFFAGSFPRTSSFI